MSWFSGLAGKAESLLDKMDQAAAVSLQGAGLATSPQRNTNSPNIQSTLAYEPTAQLPEADRGTKVAQQLIGSLSGAKLVAKPTSTKPPLKNASTVSTTSTEQPKPHSSSFTPSRTKDPTPSDESLFEFLNSPSKQPGQSGSRRVKHTTSKVQHMRSRPPPTPPSPVKVQPASVVAASEERPLQTSTESRETQIRKEESILEETDAPPSASHDAQQHCEVAKEDNTRKDDSDQGKPVNSSDSTSQILEQSQLVTLQQRVSNLELENKLLKREVASLNDELGVMMGRVRDAGENVAQYEREISTLREHTSQSDRMIRQMRSQEEDLQAALEARDSQIEILRTRLLEADQAVEEMKQHISSSSKEKERLLQDANLTSDIHNHALESLKAQLEQTEALLQREREAASTMKVEFTERESQLQSEQLQLSEALSTQQRQLALQQAKATEYQTALQSAHRELQLRTKDHEDYKQRAAGILQAKERLIASLQGGGGGDSEGRAAWEAQLEEVRLEREHLRAQLQSTHQQLENIQADMQELEDHHSSEVHQLLEQVQVAEGALSEERRAHMATQTELSRVSQELEESREETGRERASQAMLLKEKETELHSLRTKLSSAAPGRAELESRLHELTESLIQKQTTLEALSSEKSSLNVQLQRMKDELSEAKRIYPNRTSLPTVVNGLESAESDSSRVRSISPILSSSDSKERLHNVRRAVNTVDRVSIRLGVLLRRYPYARLFAILYMVLLHIWVMVVLLTYTPEVHDSL